MIRRFILVVLVSSTAATVHAGSTLAESWLRVQQALASQDYEVLDQRILEFQQAADDVAVRRLTPYADALVTWAKDHPSPLAESVARRARVLDPELPSSYFLLSRIEWERRQWLGALKAYFTGWWAMFLFEPSRRALLSSIGTWLAATVAWTLLAAILIQTVGHLRQLLHDAVEVSSLVIRRPNAHVLALALLGLPVFFGLGPLWLLMYLFVMIWVYMGTGQRVAAVVSCCVLALVLPAMAVWQGWYSLQASTRDRIATMLDERSLDPSALREFSEFESELEGIAPYHMVLGELVRMHGDAEGARLQFQKAALHDDGSPDPLIFLGNLSMEEGDIQRAIQRYDAAIDLEPRAELAYHNLSAAYDQSRRFQEGDAARDMARQLAGKRTKPIGIRGRDARVRYPELGRDTLDRLVAAAPPGLITPPRSSLSGKEVVGGLLGRVSLVFWIAALAGIVVLAVRSRWSWIAEVCTKCGKVFCPRCKSATESATYCSQCISVFLKRDMVSIEQQSAKMEQIRRWEARSSVAHRIAGILVPGSHELLEGKVWLGLVVGFVGWFLLWGLLIWAPSVLQSIDPLVAVVPVQIVFGIGCALVWLRSIAGAWHRS
jgi:tetratricopeptide (TPR) repeat protein